MPIETIDVTSREAEKAEAFLEICRLVLLFPLLFYPALVVALTTATACIYVNDVLSFLKIHESITLFIVSCIGIFMLALPAFLSKNIYRRFKAAATLKHYAYLGFLYSFLSVSSFLFLGKNLIPFLRQFEITDPINTWLFSLVYSIIFSVYLWSKKKSS